MDGVLFGIPSSRKKSTGNGHIHLASSPLGRSVTQSQNLPTYFFSFGPSQHSLRLFLETSLGKTLTAVGPTRAGLVLWSFSKPKHQSTTNPGSVPARGPSAGSGFAALAKAFAGDKFRPNPRGCGLNSGRASPFEIF